jgi:hypothetical protein
MKKARTELLCINLQGLTYLLNKLNLWRNPVVTKISIKEYNAIPVPKFG